MAGKGGNMNPMGIGGLQTRPQDRSNGRWSKENSFSYWMNFFKQLNTKAFLSWKKDNPEHTMAASLAYERVLKGRIDLKEFQEVANRTEGMPKTSLELSGPEGAPIEISNIEALNKIYGNDPNRKTSDAGQKNESTKGTD